jgi:hypothetical protein
MFSPEFTQEAMAMVDLRPQLISGRPTLRVALLLPAAALIFIGSMFQLGMLGYGQFNPHGLWPAVMILQSVWDLLAAHFNAPEMIDVSQYWPLLLVGCGFAILIALGSGTVPRSRRGVREGE